MAPYDHGNELMYKGYTVCLCHVQQPYKYSLSPFNGFPIKINIWSNLSQLFIDILYLWITSGFQFLFHSFFNVNNFV